MKQNRTKKKAGSDANPLAFDGITREELQARLNGGSLVAIWILREMGLDSYRLFDLYFGPGGAMRYNSLGRRMQATMPFLALLAVHEWLCSEVRKSVKGVEQLTQEGAIQLFRQAGAGVESYIVGTVGTLQFDVLTYRLKSEYGVDIELVMQPFEVARWLTYPGEKPVTPESLRGADRGMFVYDRNDRPVLLVNNEWSLGWITDNNPSLQMHTVPADRKEI